jgi:hypothetical protein
MTKTPPKRMGRPPKPEDERLDVITMRIAAPLASEIERAAREFGVGKSTAARMLIEQALAARKRRMKA